MRLLFSICMLFNHPNTFRFINRFRKSSKCSLRSQSRTHQDELEAHHLDQGGIFRDLESAVADELSHLSVHSSGSTAERVKNLLEVERRLVQYTRGAGFTKAWTDDLDSAFDSVQVEMSHPRH